MLSGVAVLLTYLHTYLYRYGLEVFYGQSPWSLLAELAQLQLIHKSLALEHVFDRFVTGEVLQKDR